MIGVPTPRPTYASFTARDTTQIKPFVDMSIDDPTVIVRTLSEALAEEPKPDWLTRVTKKSSQSRPSKSLSKEEQYAEEEGSDSKPKGRTRGFFKRLFGLR